MMSRERWAAVSAIFSDALTLTGAARVALIERRCGDDTALKHEVEAMLESNERAGAFLDAPPLLDDRVGAALGSWMLEREIGRGGMGAVWAASRADGAYRQCAAIKLVRGGASDSWLARRFMAERQILASLSHPLIARLLDGGTTADGVPWLAMEYVDGQRIDAYCAERQLPLRARLELFLEVAAAVAYAHQHLVVHRDIKPANVLVTSDGSPRLLDFGIARLLDAEHPTTNELTSVTARALTPAWASPEQIRGGPVTTASDVYSLGVLLYQLVTGRLPCGEGALSTELVLRAVLEEEPQRPSLVAVGQRIEGDLDSVILKALEKDVSRRYASVAFFARDLERYLAGQPVEAHAASFWYRSKKTIRRHRGVAIALMLLVISLCAGIVATTWEAHVASRERARAEKHFREIRALSNSLIFEVHDAIQYLPGATEARAKVTAKAVEFLDQLAADATDDDALARELALGYVKVAEAQSSLSFANLGDNAGAEKTYAKADALLEPLVRRSTVTNDDRAALATLRHPEAEFYLQQGRYEKALSAAQESLDLRQAILDSTPENNDARRGVANALNRLGDILAEGTDHARTLATYEQVNALYQALVAREPKSARNRWGVICAYTNEGEELAKRHRDDEARVAFERALELNAQLELDKPDNYSILQAYGILLNALGGVAQRQNDFVRARTRFEEALQRRQTLASKDAKDMAAALFVAQTHRELGALLVDSGQPTEAMKHFDEAGHALDAIEKVEPGLRVALGRVNLAVAKAKAERALKRDAAACATLEQAQRVLPTASLATVKQVADELQVARTTCPSTN